MKDNMQHNQDFPEFTYEKIRSSKVKSASNASSDERKRQKQQDKQRQQERQRKREY